jgi:hypothetical protein
MANAKEIPTPEVTEEAMPEIDERISVLLTGKKATVIAMLAEIRKDYEAAKAVTDTLKNDHDNFVLLAKTVRKDMADLAKIETRGRKVKGETSEEVTEAD